MNLLALQHLPKRHVIAGFGNPLLDFTAAVKGTTILEKYNLKPDGQKEVNCEEFSDIFKSLKSENYEIAFSPGGCTQNTLRIIQAVVKYPSFCVYFGGLGDDEEGKLLMSEVNRCGVDTRYAIHSAYPTGKTAALINGENRSLVTHLGAAEIYSVEDFMKPENLKIMEEIFIVYIEGFFITHSFDVSLEAINICKAQGVVVAFNISGVYVAEFYPKELIASATAADIVFGNVSEFKALAKIIGLEYSSLEELALKLYTSLWIEKTPSKFKLGCMNHFGKSLVITQGKEPVCCVYQNQNLVMCEVPYLDSKLFKDSTGAGDAFAAGFLVTFLQNKPVSECLAYGCVIAQQVVQQIGVNFPESFNDGSIPLKTISLQ